MGTFAIDPLTAIPTVQTLQACGSSQPQSGEGRSHPTHSDHHTPLSPWSSLLSLRQGKIQNAHSLAFVESLQ